ncbi:MAG: glycoside hydrolase family 15 protein [Acidobacteriota bacterium]
MNYQPIQNYGIIGDMYTSALVGMNGSVDWFCFPFFDSPSVFAAILDHEKGGRFQIAPLNSGVTPKQVYWPDTNVLVTRFYAREGVAEIIDYMPVGQQARSLGSHRLVRRVNMARGTMVLKMQCTPAFNYGREAHQTDISEKGAAFHTSWLSLGLGSSIPLQASGTGVGAEFSLEEGETRTFIFGEIDPSSEFNLLLTEDEVELQFKRTVEFWRHWISKCTYRGRWREMVYRSALALKLLTFEPSGAIVAAPTCSLPEEMGGQRNWDYRYTWIRDAAFTLYALLRIGFTEEAGRFMHWLEAVCQDLPPENPLQVMYGIDGRPHLTEEELDHLEGYKGSRPVRIGNAAYNQLQLDIYGELMDSIYLFNKHGSPISYDLWSKLRVLVNWVCDHWHHKDEGIWEVRGGRQHFVYSKLMCWVAIDRGLRLADKRSFPADRDRWLKVRDEIYEDIMRNGWDPQLNAFSQYYGSRTLDASNLIIPLVLFLSAADPRMLSTIQAINRSPSQGGLVSDSLVYRYNVNRYDDGLEGEEGTFNMCTFWLVEALTRAGKSDRAYLDQARLMFEKMLGYANHLGLYAEETGPSGEALGNFPQAFTHLSLISAAVNLDRVLGTQD